MLSLVRPYKDGGVSTLLHFAPSLGLVCQSNKYDSGMPPAPDMVPQTWAVTYCCLLATFSDFVARPCLRRQTTKAHLDPLVESRVAVVARLHGLVQASPSCPLQSHAGGLTLLVGVDVVTDRVV